MPEKILEDIYIEFRESLNIIKKISEIYSIPFERLISIKQAISKDLFSGATYDKIDDRIEKLSKKDLKDKISSEDLKKLIIPPDIDEATNSLQLMNCTRRYDQDKIISYIAGKEMLKKLLIIFDSVDKSRNAIFDIKTLPVGEINDKFVLLQI